MAADRFITARTTAATGTRGSSTVATTDAGPSLPIDGTAPTLRLRAEAEERSDSRHIQWAEDVVDNEGMGKKSSKVCCIYHKPKNVGDSSSDESPSSDSDSDSEPDLSRARPAKKRSGRAPRDHGHGHHHDHSQDHGSGCDDPQEGGPGPQDKGKGRRASPNAYERVPRRKKDKS